ncbi:type I-E CRISPR-associated protein Cse2/CasB [Glycomyces arizonensis]|uniref:type I-E CRISPR-associated protein Cse2/CasB n=1 Tax=Glycomyces arizonensis TaxID=256035 RepID=UPI000404DEA7|nr:type I-E CRISPR-associated protein Cse2/CasB [Glycomyces arizonensis]
MSEVETKPRNVRHRRREPLGDFVAAQVAKLQRRYRRRESTAVATLAKLRRDVHGEPGVELALSGIDPLPPELLGPAPGDEATRSERAVHTALTLYAVHQQSQSNKDMHVNGPSFATQVALLAAGSPSPEAVRRRFAAAGTASTYQELRHHTRGLVTRLRAEGIGMDYGRFADDLAVFLGRGGPERLRGYWGRDYWRAQTSDHDQNDSQEQE